MSHEQVACLPLPQCAVLIKRSLVEFGWCFRTARVMSRGGWSREVLDCDVDHFWQYQSTFTIKPFSTLPSPACCSRPVACSIPSTGSILTQLDARHELNSRVILCGILKGMYTLLQNPKGLQFYFLGTGWRTPQPWSTIYEVGCCTTAFSMQHSGTGAPALPYHSSL